MYQADRFDKDGNKIGTVPLPEALFVDEPNFFAMHQYVKTYLANQRQGNASTKTRAEVRGGGRKPWVQKGTGRARAGTINSPLWRHGGVVFGPKPRNYKMKLPKKVKRLAFKSALTQRAKESAIKVVENITLDKPSTKTIKRILANMTIPDGEHILFLTAESDTNLYKSVRNIEKVNIKPTGELNAYDIIRHTTIIATEDSIRKLEERLSK
ncbi:50S ribosomal protein L4 [bacterium]|nr:50S ribosomal protein L4 [bacterium]